MGPWYAAGRDRSARTISISQEVFIDSTTDGNIETNKKAEKPAVH
jgi:hypothetical protein